MIEKSKIVGMLLSLTVLAILAMPVYAADDAAAGNMAVNASGGNAVTVNIAAKDTAFNMSTITVPAGAEVTVNFENEDSGVQHNIGFYQDQSASKEIYKGQPITGPNKITYTFTAPSEPGPDFCRCDTPPTAMTGQLIVK